MIKNNNKDEFLEWKTCDDIENISRPLPEVKEDTTGKIIINRKK